MNYYQILGVNTHAHPAEIEAAYRTLKGSEAVEAWEQINITLAYQTLISPDKRRSYDLALAGEQDIPGDQAPQSQGANRKEDRCRSQVRNQREDMVRRSCGCCGSLWNGSNTKAVSLITNLALGYTFGMLIVFMVIMVFAVYS